MQVWPEGYSERSFRSSPTAAKNSDGFSSSSLWNLKVDSEALVRKMYSNATVFNSIDRTGWLGDSWSAAWIWELERILLSCKRLEIFLWRNLSQWPDKRSLSAILVMRSQESIWASLEPLESKSGLTEMVIFVPQLYIHSTIKSKSFGSSSSKWIDSSSDSLKSLVKAAFRTGEKCRARAFGRLYEIFSGPIRILTAGPRRSLWY